MDKVIIPVTYKFTASLIKLAKKNKKFVILDADLSDDLNLKASIISSLSALYKTGLQSKIWFQWLEE